MRRTLQIGAGLGLALFLVTCTDRNPSGPAGRGATALNFSAFGVRAAGDPLVPVDSLRITLTRPGAATPALDTTLGFHPDTAAGDSGVVKLAVELNQNSEDFVLVVTAFGSGITWYRAVDTVQVVANQTVAGNLLARYVGPGANAARVAIAPVDTTVVGGRTYPLRATVYDSSGQPIAGVPVGYRASDTLFGAVAYATPYSATYAGPLLTRDSVRLVAETPTHLKDSTWVHVIPPAASLALASGDAQTGPVGVPLPAPLCVRVLDQLGGPFQGQVVTWSVTAGAGTLSASSVPSDAGGFSCVTLTPVALGSVAVQAAAAGLAGSPVTFTETVAGASAIAIVSGDSQTDTVGAALTPFVVKVTDAQNNPVAGAKVFWSRIAGTGTVSADTTVTDAAGLTQITYTLGATPGTEQVRATLVGSTANVVFAVTVVAGAVRSVTLAQLNDTVPKGGTLQYTATARDGAGNVVAAAITWTSTAAGIASVNSAGLATAVAGGTTSIIAASGGFADTATLWVRALSSIAVTPADTVITAVGDSLLLRAAALDNFGDTVTSGVVLRFVSATPTVATVNALTGRSYIVGPGNAVVLARDTLSGIQGPATLRVNQIPVALINTPPDSILVGIGGRAQITARSIDRNGHPIPGKTINWISRDPAIATTDQLGVVSGIALGSTYVVDSLVDSAGTFLDSTRVDVVPSPPALIQWAFDSTAVGNGGNLSIALSLSRTDVSPVIVKLAAANPATDTFIAKPRVKAVTFSPGTASASVIIDGLSAGRVVLIASDSLGSGYLPDTMVVTVVSTIEFREIGSFSRQSNFYVNRNETYRAQVFLSDPAPAGGLGVTFVYGNAGTSAVSPSPAIIPAGQLAADVTIQGLGAGRDSVTPTSGGFVGRFAYVDVAPESLYLALPYPYNGVLGVGQTFQPYVYYTYSMDHPLAITLTLAPAIGTVPGTVTVPSNSYYQYFTVGANALGTATLTVSAPGWLGRSVPVTFSTPRLQATGTSSMVAGDPSLGYWYAYTEDSLGYGHPVIDTVPVTAISRTDTAVTVSVAGGKVLPGSSTASVSNALRALPTAGGDSSWIVLSAPGYQPDSFQVYVTRPTLGFYLSYPYDGRVGLGTLFQNAGYVQIPYVRPDTFWVVFGHTDRAVLGGPDSVAILPGQTYTYFDVRGDQAGSDVVSIARATGYVISGGPYTFQTDPLRVAPYNYPTTLYTISTPALVSAYAFDSVNGAARPLLAPLTVNLSATNPAAFTLDSPTVTIPVGTYVSGYDTLRVAGVDTVGSFVVASGAGVASDTSSAIRVYPTPLGLGIAYPYTVGRGMKLQNNYVYVSGGNAPDTIRVALTHTTPAVDSLTRDTVLILPGQSYSQYFDILGLDTTATDTITASAVGYVSGTTTIRPEPARLDVSDPGPTHLTTDPPFQLRTYTETRFGYGQKPIAPVTYTIVSSNPNVIRIDSTGPGGAVNGTRDTATAVVDTALYYSDVWISFVGSGTAKLFVSAPGFAPDSSAPTNVTGPSLGLAYTTLTVGKGQVFTSQYVYVNNPVTAPLTVRLARSDSTLPPANQVFTLANDSVVINTGQTSSPFFVITGNAIGSAQLIARASGYSQAVSTISVGQPQLSVSPTQSLYVGQRPPTVTVYTNDQNGNNRLVAAPTVIADSSSDSTVAKGDSASRTIPAGQNFAQFDMLGLKKGGVQVVFSSPGYKSDTMVVTVDTAKLDLQGAPNGLGTGQVAQGYMYVQLPYYTDSALVVTLASTNTGVLTVPASVTIPAGSYYNYFDVTGVGPGTAGVVATAPHSIADTLAVTISTPKLAVSLTLNTSAGQTYSVTVFARDSLNVDRSVTAPLSVTLTSSSPGHTAFATNPITVAAGNSLTSTTVVFDTAGIYTVTATATGYTPGNAATTTTGALVRMSGTLFVPQTVTIPAGQIVTWRNDDPGLNHTTTEDGATPLWDSGTLTTGQTYQRQFSSVGTFTYHCNVHPGMTGTVIVN